MVDVRLKSLVRNVVHRFFNNTDEFGIPEDVAFGDECALDDLYVDDMALEDLCIFVNARLEPERSITLLHVEQCGTVADLCQVIAAHFQDQAMRGATRYLAPTVWLSEFTAPHAASNTGRLLQIPGSFAFNPDKTTVRLRRTHTEVGPKFRQFWSTLEAHERRERLFAVAPLPESPEETSLFAASLALLPEYTADNLTQGDTFVQLLETRCTQDYAKQNRADLDVCVKLKTRFSVPTEWVKKVVVLETREVISLHTHKDEARVRDRLNAGAAVSGLLWAMFLARTCSKTALFQAVLDNFRKSHVEAVPLKAGKKVAKPRCCNLCRKETDQLSRCTVCKKAWYCSRECQGKAWPQHKQTCGKPSFALKF